MMTDHRRLAIICSRHVQLCNRRRPSDFLPNRGWHPQGRSAGLPCRNLCHNGVAPFAVSRVDVLGIASHACALRSLRRAVSQIVLEWSLIILMIDLIDL